jgi:hypothetical protein
MSTPGDALGEITKIGNYAIPAFGATVTAALALGPISKSDPQGHTIVVYFALYTIFSAYVAYGHRLAWLRYRRSQKERGKEPANLPRLVVLGFMFVHLVLIVSLVWCLCALGVV